MGVMNDNKIVVYQVLTRLFGNTNTTNKPWGTIEENGVGKFADFTTKALEELKALGVTHIWFTGVLHHALTTDYTAYGISNDFPAVVKGRAGSPYAIKDWEALIARTHQCGLKVIMDIVPNHVARRYESIAKPEGTRGFGEDDDTTVQYAVNNNFYYNPNEAFQLPEGIYGEYHEFPAKWTGNGTRASKPDRNDWYETVKLNYGVRPDGTKDFIELPASFENEDTEAHYHFWADKTIPDTWRKFKDIALYWLGKGVDGFRYDMAEMVPVEFWSYLNSAIKHQNPKAFLLAEVYNPNEYRPYLHLGKMDYLYDKVQLYDTLRNIVTHGHSTDAIVAIQSSLADIAHRMLHFLENHDEQRIASPEFAGYAENAKPAMTVSTFISESPVMLYFGQEVGEKAAEVAGFGSPSRTSIFDYIGVPAHQRWVNNKCFDGGQLSEAERSLRNFYQRLLNLKVNGAYIDLHQYNRQHTEYYNDRVYSFARGNEDEQWVIVSNFSEHDYFGFDLQLPDYLLGSWFLNDGTYTLIDALYNEKHTTLQIVNGKGRLRVDIAPLESLIFKISKLVDS